jgi:hypothetical protein
MPIINNNKKMLMKIVFGVFYPMTENRSMCDGYTPDLFTPIDTKEWLFRREKNFSSDFWTLCQIFYLLTPRVKRVYPLHKNQFSVIGGKTLKKICIIIFFGVDDTACSKVYLIQSNRIMFAAGSVVFSRVPWFPSLIV